MRKKIYGAILVGAVVIGALTGCGNTGSEQKVTSAPATIETNDKAVDSEADEAKTADEGEAAAVETPAAELKTVRFGSPNSGGKLLFELLEVAYLDGTLEEELNSVGYTGTYQIIDAAGPAINEAFAAGELDVAIYGDFPATTAKSNGIDTTVIGVSNSDQGQAIFAREGSGIETVKDLEGKKVAVGLGTNYQYYWENLISGEELDISKIEVVNSFDYATLLTTGDVDAASISIVQAIYFEQLGLGHAIIDSSTHPDWTTEFLVVAKTDYINANPDVGIAVNKALIKARQRVEADINVLAESIENENINKELYLEAFDRIGINGYDPETFLSDTPVKLQKVIDLMYNDGLIGTQINAAEWIDSSYYEKAKEELQ